MRYKGLATNSSMLTFYISKLMHIIIFVGNLYISIFITFIENIEKISIHICIKLYVGYMFHSACWLLNEFTPHVGS